MPKVPRLSEPYTDMLLVRNNKKNLDLTELCKIHFKELGLLTVPSIYMFEVISYVKEHLVKAHQHSYNTRNRNFNPSISHKLKMFENKSEYIGLKLLSQITTKFG